MELVIVFGTAGLLLLTLGFYQLACVFHWISKYGED